MERYDPELAPDPSEWLALDEAERIVLAEQYHRESRISIPKAARRLHACIHVAVENQLALNDDPVVRAQSRLRKEGLTRHDTVHAIGSVVAELIYDAMNLKGTPQTSNIHYYAAIERLTAKSWRESNDG